MAALEHNKVGQQFWQWEKEREPSLSGGKEELRRTVPLMRSGMSQAFLKRESDHTQQRRELYSNSTQKA